MTDTFVNDVDTCSVCRTWVIPMPDSAASVKVNQILNQHGEIDILFCDEAITSHMADRATQHAATKVQSETMEELVGAIETAWCSIHGPQEADECVPVPVSARVRGVLSRVPGSSSCDKATSLDHRFCRECDWAC